MPRRKNIAIKYTSRDFRQIKEDLVQHAKRYYPETFKDFSDASFGSLLLDSVSYVGDVLSFYLDYQANESFMDSSIEYDNIRRHAEQLGYKYTGTKASYGTLSFFILVPSNSDGTAPDFSYIPLLKSGSSFSAANGVTFVLTEDVDFSSALNDVVAARFDGSTGATTFFAIRAHGQVASGRLAASEIDMTNDPYERFKRIRIGDDKITTVVSVIDNEGNEYHEVDYLTQEVVFKEMTNPTAASDGVRNILKPFIAARRFIVEQDETGTYIQFGFGSEQDSETTGLVDPSRVALKMHGRRNITTSTFDPNELISTNKLGISPSGKILRILFRTNEQVVAITPANTVRNVVSTRFEFENETSLSSNIMNSVRTSLEVNNDSTFTGDIIELTREELKIRAKSYFATQGRAVTAQDYESLIYSMPAKFGGVSRVGLVNDPSSTNRRISMYVVSQNERGQLTTTNAVTKNNIKNYIANYKSLNDVIDIIDAKIVNFGIEFSVVSSPNFNASGVINNAVDKLKEYFEDHLYIGEPIYISEIFNTLNKTEGVVDVKKVKVFNKGGVGYSPIVLDFDDLISKDGSYLKVPKNVIMELKYPNLDIRGIIK